jgi:ABC-type transport system involved in cytochrome bd biosynthesis fused ATPase/permease subunit
MSDELQGTLQTEVTAALLTPPVSQLLIYYSVFLPPLFPTVIVPNALRDAVTL